MSESLKFLTRLEVGRSLKPTLSIRSSVTTAWGVRWDEESIARDVMQNFFDANQGVLGEVTVHVEAETVTILGPAPCNLEQLFFFGSEKDANTNVGQYEEGFEAAATCL